MIYISITDDNVIRYPKHIHKTWEIMIYLEGNGYLYTEKGNIPFEIGTIIAVPPRIEHGSISKNGFKNISVGSSFEHFLVSDEIIVLTDNDKNDGRILAEMIYRNRNSSKQYLDALCAAYATFILGELKVKSTISLKINEITDKINEAAYDMDIDVTKILVESGYSEDYIRQQFKAAIGLCPLKYLAKIRMERARFLIDVYGKNLTLSEIAEKCGYTDYVYFSKTFKAYMGVSPREYKNLYT